MSIDQIEEEAQKIHLTNVGAFHGSVGDDFTTLVLLGPGKGFWDMFKHSPEYKDGASDPMDRWSTRNIQQLAQHLGATARFPFGGPPHYSFLGYAQKSMSAFPSRVGMLVHHQQGLMISFRGALCFDKKLLLQTPEVPHPCESCASTPCLSACPVNAITNGKYDVNVCKSHLNTQKGKDCLQQGCKIRKVCPLSAGAKREPDQSGFHMRRFLEG